MADLFDFVVGCISFICVPCLLICTRHANKEDPVAPEPVIRTVVIHPRVGSFHSVSMDDSTSDPTPLKDDGVRII
jgi:hypothetical protein